MSVPIPPPPPPAPLAAPGSPGPGRKWYALAAVLFLIGAVGGGLLLYKGVSGFREGVVRVPVPEGSVVELHEAGTWSIFYEYRGELDGVFYSNPPQVPEELEVSVVDSTGAQVEVGAPIGSFNYATGGHSGVSIGAIEVTVPGRHTIEVTYPGPERFNLALGRSIGRKTLHVVLGAITIGAFGFIAFVVWLIVFILRYRAKRSPA